MASQPSALCVLPHGSAIDSSMESHRPLARAQPSCDSLLLARIEFRRDRTNRSLRIPAGQELPHPLIARDARATKFGRAQAPAAAHAGEGPTPKRRPIESLAASSARKSVRVFRERSQSLTSGIDRLHGVASPVPLTRELLALQVTRFRFRRLAPDVVQSLVERRRFVVTEVV